MNNERQAGTDDDSSNHAELLSSASLAQSPVLNAVAVYDRNGNKLDDGDEVEIKCHYKHELNGVKKRFSIKYKGVKSEGYDFGKAQVNEYYSLLLDGESWESFTLSKGDEFKQEEKSFKCNSIIKVGSHCI